jgi:hypothetical protein
VPTNMALVIRLMDHRPRCQCGATSDSWESYGTQRREIRPMDAILQRRSRPNGLRSARCRGASLSLGAIGVCGVAAQASAGASRVGIRRRLKTRPGQILGMVLRESIVRPSGDGDGLTRPQPQALRAFLFE